VTNGAGEVDWFVIVSGVDCQHFRSAYGTGRVADLLQRILIWIDSELGAGFLEDITQVFGWCAFDRVSSCCAIDDHDMRGHVVELIGSSWTEAEGPTRCEDLIDSDGLFYRILYLFAVAVSSCRLSLRMTLPLPRLERQRGDSRLNFEHVRPSHRLVSSSTHCNINPNCFRIFLL